MNKYIVTLLILLTCLLTACGFRDFMNERMADASGQAVGGRDANMRNSFRNNNTSTGTSDKNEPKAGLAASPSAVSGSGINPAEHVSAKMQTAEFWINKTVSADKILMSGEEIRQFNNDMLEKLSVDTGTAVDHEGTSDRSPEAVYYDLSGFGDTLDQSVVQNMIQKHNVFIRSYSYYTGDDLVTEKQWTEYQSLCNFDAIADKNKVRYGIICTRADMRVLPTMDNITDVKGDYGHDLMQSTALAVNEPVLIIHDSSDSRWYYVIANEYAGWVLQDRVALCENKEEWQKAQQMEDFLVVTGDEIAIRQSTDTESSDLIFTMGTKLAIADPAEYQEVMGRKKIYDNYVVRVPVRESGGRLDYCYVLVPLGKDVSHGYLDYTRANVLRQAFKLLGNPYGWGGMNGGRDCSSMTRDSYLCFGFRLPRDASSQAMIPGKGCISLNGLSDAERREKINSIQPGTILQMPGHVMIYLGCRDQHYYVISANGTFMPAGSADQSSLSDGSYQTRLVTVNDLEVKSPSSKKTWMEQIAVIVGIP